MQGLLKRFAEQQAVWTGAVAAMAQLDALMSLSAAAEQCSAWGPVCRPVFLPADSNRQVCSALEATSALHLNAAMLLHEALES